MIFHIAQVLGAHLADGSAAAAFQHSRIEPLLQVPGEDIILDFSGVRNSNSSFMNALLSGLIEKHGEPALERLLFKGCNPVITVMVESAIELGIQKHSRRVVV